jgi:alkaline phosphatase D
LRYGNGAKRGYMKMELTGERCTAELRALDSEKHHDSGISTIAAWIVENGRPGAQRA